MKLLKATSEEVRDFNEVEFLQMENDFLKDELELQDALHSLELMETVLKCIEQEGEVSKSIEVMFGEGQDMSTFKDALQKAYDESVEVMIRLTTLPSKMASINAFLKPVEAKLSMLRKQSESNASPIKFPIKFKSIKNNSRMNRFVMAYTYIDDFLKNKKFEKSILRELFNGVKEILLGDTEPEKFDDVSISSKAELKQWFNEVDGWIATIKKFGQPILKGNIGAKINEHYDNEKTQLVMRVYGFLLRTSVMVVSRVLNNFEKGLKESKNDVTTKTNYTDKDLTF